MSRATSEIFLEDLKEDAEFFIKNFKEILKRTWSDIRDDFRNF